MELTEYLFMIFAILIITMTSHIKVKVFMMKRLVFMVVVIVIVIVILDKQLCKLYISDTNGHNDKYFSYLRYLCFGSKYCDIFWSFSRGTDGFNPYDFKSKSHKTTTEKTPQCIYCVF